MNINFYLFHSGAYFMQILNIHRV